VEKYGPVEWIVIGLTFMLIFAGYLATQSSIEALDDPNDTSRVYLDQLPHLAMLADTGVYRILILRQSGNIHAEYEAAGASEAIAKAVSTFRRAQIDAIRISRNSPNELHFNRLIYNHRGSAEGKKVGSVQITRVA